jgi:hypothetical protein
MHSWVCPSHAHVINFQENAMGKYLLAWLFGVPAIVLVLIYFFLH